jgi:hypothetical protein
MTATDVISRKLMATGKTYKARKRVEIAQCLEGMLADGDERAAPYHTDRYRIHALWVKGGPCWVTRRSHRMLAGRAAWGRRRSRDFDAPLERRCSARANFCSTPGGPWLAASAYSGSF